MAVFFLPPIAADLAHNAFGKNTPVEDAVERVARETYGTTVFAHCAPTNRPNGYGFSSTFHHTVRLDSPVCEALGDIITSTEAVDASDFSAVNAILTTAHELSHVDGAGLGEKRNEGVTQCVAVQRTAQVAEALGVPAEDAKAIATSAASMVIVSEGSEYAIPSGCSDGGRYDINAPGDHFPRSAEEAFLNGDW